MDQEKRKKIIFIAGGAVLALIALLIAYNVFIGKKSGSSIFALPSVGGSREVLPSVPDLYMEYGLFDQITKMFGPSPRLVEGVPVEVGEQGKANPFEPFGGFNGGPVSSPTPGPSTTPSQNPSPSPSDVGQGT